MAPQGRTLILSDGGLTSLLAAAIVGDEDGRRARDRDVSAERSLLWACGTSGDLDPVCAQAAAQHAQIFSLEYVPPIEFGGAAAAILGLRGEVETMTLVRACYLAAARGARRVLWPVQLPRTGGRDGDLDQMSRAIDRALLVSRLVSIDEADIGVPEVTIETPFVDLDDDQISDLALDMELPIEACWWSGGYGQAPGSARERERWLPLLGGESLATNPSGRTASV
ncbi:MAG: hypothetical protein R3B57_10575 [Phycisphaerales bacterium]